VKSSSCIELGVVGGSLVRFAASKQSFFTLMFALFATPFAPSIALCLLQPEIRGRKFCVLPRPAPPLGYDYLWTGFVKNAKSHFIGS